MNKVSASESKRKRMEQDGVKRFEEAKKLKREEI